MRTTGNYGTYMHVIYAYSTTHIGYGTDSDEIVSYTDGKRKNKASSKKLKNRLCQSTIFKEAWWYSIKNLVEVE